MKLFQNCSGFYVYKLVNAPGCKMAYCAGDIEACHGNEYWCQLKETCVGKTFIMTLRR